MPKLRLKFSDNHRATPIPDVDVKDRRACYVERSAFMSMPAGYAASAALWRLHYVVRRVRCQRKPVNPVEQTFSSRGFPAEGKCKRMPYHRNHAKLLREGFDCLLSAYALDLSPNVFRLVLRLVQVGLRDWAEQEAGHITQCD